MPRGKKNTPEAAQEAEGAPISQETPKESPEEFQARIREANRKRDEKAPVLVFSDADVPPLDPGQKYFVVPETNEHVIGDADKDTILYKPKDGRKPFLINPKR